MRIYPAIRASMGDWNYYIVRMKMSEVAQEVDFARDVHEAKTLSEAIQRIMDDKRVKKQIVSYLSRRSDRFFSSIVVAAIGGEPRWHSVDFDPNVVPSVLADSVALRESFGVLSFGDEPKYYALDGQHRVFAIKHLLSGKSDFPKPEGFENDQLSVIVVLREEHDVPQGEWLRRYRRLFSSLNRYARATDKDTNIIMDEDDAIAILTRRLIAEHRFFVASGDDPEEFRVVTKGANVKERKPQFTSLQILYKLNEELLSTRERVNSGWSDDGSLKLNKQMRPEKEWLDARYTELSAYWDAIIAALPVVENPPERMRCHDAEEKREVQDDDVHDNFLFWPIGQLAFVKVVRRRLDDHFLESGLGEVDAMARALAPLRRIPWELHGAPWRGLMLVRTEDKNGAMKWTMRNEDRTKAIAVAERLLQWMSGVVEFDDEDTSKLRAAWSSLLYPRPDDDERDKMWATVVEARERVLSSSTD